MDIEEQMGGCQGEGLEERMQEGFGVSKCNLVYIEWINNKVLLYSTGSYIQYSVINHNAKDMKKVYVRVTESLRCTAEINMTL